MADTVSVFDAVGFAGVSVPATGAAAVGDSVTSFLLF